MAAPSGTTWGSIAGDYGRIGIYTSMSSTNTETTLTVEVWFHSKYSVSDNLGNALYLDNLAAAGSATTDRGGTNIQTKVATGEGWSTSNQVKLTGKSYTWKHARGTSASTRYLYAKLTGVDRVGATMSVSKTVSIPALASYTISYNANGGTGSVPSKQTKYYSIGLTIPASPVPTKTGHTFQGWALSKAEADAGRWYYKPGSTCGRNENLTLYAVWKPDTYTISYNANGGTGAPGNQTKTYGITLTVSNEIPTLTNYAFLGWALSKAEADAGRWYYKPGSSCGANSNLTLYAVWELIYVKPRVNVSTVSRCDKDGNISDAGTCACFELTYQCDKPTVNAVVTFESDSAGTISRTLPFVGVQGVTAQKVLISDVTLSIESTYTVKITITDELGYGTAVITLPGSKFIMDVLRDGKGIAFNKPAELEGVMDVGFQTYLRGGLRYGVLENGMNIDSVLTPGFYVGSHTFEYVNCPVNTGSSFTLEVMSGGDIGQLIQRMTTCDMGRHITHERSYYESYWGKWMKTSPTVIYEEMFYTPSAAETFELVGSITIPKRTAFTFTARGMWQNSRCHGVIISDRRSTDNGNHPYSYSVAACFNEDDRVFFPSCTYSGNTGDDALTFYIWSKWQATNLNKVEVSGYYMPY